MWYRASTVALLLCKLCQLYTQKWLMLGASHTQFIMLVASSRPQSSQILLIHGFLSSGSNGGHEKEEAQWAILVHSNRGHRRWCSRSWSILVTYCSTLLNANEYTAPALRPKLLGVLNCPQMSACLRRELADIVDWGELFVKACYFVEGDGPLAVDCYEAIDRILAGLRIPNVHVHVRAIAQKLSAW